uniref:F-box and WD repeat domain containing 9 n=1 Tax=Salarias fasciatus TaxID=181472 RepID=A0A672G450_SALFA
VVIYDRRADKTLKKIQLKSLMYMSYSGKEVWGGGHSGKLHCFSMQPDSFGLVSDFDVLYTCSSDRTIHIPCAPPKTLCTLHHAGELSVQAGVLAIASGSGVVEIWRSRR